MDLCPIVIASRRAHGIPGAWDDLLLAFGSVMLYAPEHKLVIAWSGESPPDIPPEYLVEQPETCRTFGSAYNFAISQVQGDCVILNDDVVLLPDTLPKLLEDVSEIKRLGRLEPGIVGCRGSYASGEQSYSGYMVAVGYGLTSNAFQRGAGPILTIKPPSRIAPFAAWIDRTAFEQIGGLPDVDWYGDDAYGLRLHRAGFGSYVSRSYVFHIGERSSSTAGIDTRELDERGRAWAAEHEPDVIR